MIDAAAIRAAADQTWTDRTTYLTRGGYVLDDHTRQLLHEAADALDHPVDVHLVVSTDTGTIHALGTPEAVHALIAALTPDPNDARR